MSLDKGLSILFILSKNQLLPLFIFAMVFFCFLAFISTQNLKISFLLLTLGFFTSSFSSCFRCRVKLFMWLFSCFLRYACIAMNLPLQFSSVQFSRSVVSDSLQPHESQHTRPPCPSPTPRVHWDSRPSSQWCHPVISSSVVPFSSCPQSLPALEYFPMSQLFAWGSQSTGVSALASFLPKYSQGWYLQNGLVGSPCSSRDSQESSPTPQFKSINSSALSLLHSPTLTSIHDHRKNHSLD